MLGAVIPGGKNKCYTISIILTLGAAYCFSCVNKMMTHWLAVSSLQDDLLHYYDEDGRAFALAAHLLLAALPALPACRHTLGPIP